MHLISVTPGEIYKVKTQTESFDSGWAVWEIPAKLVAYSDQQFKDEHHFSGWWFGKSLNDCIRSGKYGFFLHSTHLAEIFPFSEL